MRIRPLVAALAIALPLVVGTAGTAFASGGANSGGVNSGGGGGGGTPVPTGPCVQISSFSNSTGYYSAWAAIWTQFAISNSCGSPFNWQMSYTNGATGVVDFARTGSTQYMSSGTIDEDWAAFSTPYTVTLTVTDASGTVVTSRSAIVTTKAPKSGVA
jgi:hypothetical protein